jgi:hypothetical protein
MSVKNLSAYLGNTTHGDCGIIVINNIFTYCGQKRRVSAIEALESGYRPGKGCDYRKVFKYFGIKRRNPKTISEVENALAKGHPVMVGFHPKKWDYAHIYLIVDVDIKKEDGTIRFLTINRHITYYDPSENDVYTDCFSDDDYEDNPVPLWITAKLLLKDLGKEPVSEVHAAVICEITSIPLAPQMAYAPIPDLRKKLKAHVQSKKQAHKAKVCTK